MLFFGSTVLHDLAIEWPHFNPNMNNWALKSCYLNWKSATNLICLTNTPLYFDVSKLIKDWYYFTTSTTLPKPAQSNNSSADDNDLHRAQRRFCPRSRVLASSMSFQLYLNALFMHRWKAHLSQQCDQTQELKVAKAIFTLLKGFLR